MKRLAPIIVLLLLAACGGGEAETATTTAPEPTTTSEAPTTTTTEATTTTTEAPTTTTTEAEPSAEECLVGTWELDSEAFVDSLMATMGPDLPGEIRSGGGSYVVEMNQDGSLDITRDEWRYLIESPEGTLVVQIDGSESGTYEVNDETLTVTTTGGEATVSMGMLVDGEIQDLPFPIENDIEAEVFSETTQFECTEETLTVSSEIEGPTGETITFESLLVRR